MGEREGVDGREREGVEGGSGGWGRGRKEIEVNPSSRHVCTYLQVPVCDALVVKILETQNGSCRELSVQH